MFGKRIPDWQSELWSFIGTGNGMQCPLATNCKRRQKIALCADYNKVRILQLFDDTQFDANRYSDVVQGGMLTRVFQLVEMMAEEFINKGAIYRLPASNNLARLADEKRPIEVRLLPLMACHGATWFTGERWIIQLREQDTTDRQRLTLFHEAFHILAHSNCVTTPAFRKRGLRQGSYNELLADSFASYVLVPTTLAKREWPKIQDLNVMARVFDVPKSVMWFRLKKIGLI